VFDGADVDCRIALYRDDVGVETGHQLAELVLLAQDLRFDGRSGQQRPCRRKLLTRFPYGRSGVNAHDERVAKNHERRSCSMECAALFTFMRMPSKGEKQLERDRMPFLHISW